MMFPRVCIQVANKVLAIKFKSVETSLVQHDNTTDKDIVLFTDAHYYNAENVVNGMKVYSGIEFPLCAGKYVVGGEYSIDIEGYGKHTPAGVKMATNTNSIVYRHTHVTLPNRQKVMTWEDLRFVFGFTKNKIFVKANFLASQDNGINWRLEKLSRMLAIKDPGLNTTLYNDKTFTEADVSNYVSRGRVFTDSVAYNKNQLEAGPQDDVSNVMLAQTRWKDRTLREKYAEMHQYRPKIEKYVGYGLAICSGAAICYFGNGFQGNMNFFLQSLWKNPFKSAFMSYGYLRLLNLIGGKISDLVTDCAVMWKDYKANRADVDRPWEAGVLF